MGRAARLLITGIVGIALLAGGVALAGPGREARRSDGSVMLTRIARRLELTDDQQSKIREILAKHWSAGLGDAAERARMARRQLRDVIGDPSADESTVRADRAFEGIDRSLRGD